MTVTEFLLLSHLVRTGKVSVSTGEYTYNQCTLKKYVQSTSWYYIVTFNIRSMKVFGTLYIHTYIPICNHNFIIRITGSADPRRKTEESRSFPSVRAHDFSSDQSFILFYFFLFFFPPHLPTVWKSRSSNNKKMKKRWMNHAVYYWLLRSDKVMMLFMFIDRSIKWGDNWLSVVQRKKKISERLENEISGNFIMGKGTVASCQRQKK